MRLQLPLCLLAGTTLPALLHAAAPAPLGAFLESHCHECHDADVRKGDLDLTALAMDFNLPETFARWVKVFDRVQSGEMPPAKKARPSLKEMEGAQLWLKEQLLTADRTRLQNLARTGVRRLTRAEYENTVRDLFDMPGIALAGELPADGSAHGFDKNSDALDISHVNLAKYLEAADHTLDVASPWPTAEALSPTSS
jgi:hypothetical protein